STVALKVYIQGVKKEDSYKSHPLSRSVYDTERSNYIYCKLAVQSFATSFSKHTDSAADNPFDRFLTRP
ncbi:hypothetical protein, partial [Enterococcus thailandicus]|uniref:hypothetical protein n=1 Tax=Enterococcus thailandicus TaxID=417368 RepID=UPI001B809D7A